MRDRLEERFESLLSNRNTGATGDVVRIVDQLLDVAQELNASDLHLLPAEDGLRMFLRLDGVLQSGITFPKELAPNIVSRLKVLAELLTYRTDVPQEGRIRRGTSELEMRVSTFPTMFGEKAVVRLFVGSGHYRFLDDLGLPQPILEDLKRLLLETGGIILVTGPAGSGKTTTIYACLRELIDKSGGRRSLVTLEDPIEAAIPGVAQSQVKPSAGFDYQTGLKSLMRQDPDVILVGEIRDRTTAETVFQAALTGHLVLTTFHAGSAAAAIARLSDMGIEPYLLRSGILGILSQRLVRQLCECAVAKEDREARLGLDVARVFEPAGCDRCSHTGYRGRLVLAEMLLPELKGLGRAILSQKDEAEIEELAVQAGMVSRWQHALQVVTAGLTSPAEIRRVLGIAGHPGSDVQNSILPGKQSPLS